MNKGIERAYSQFYKNVHTMFQNSFRLMDTTLWPLTLLFAFTFLVQSFAGDPAIVSMVILGMMGWQVVQQTQMGMVTSYMDEFWSNSLTHLFVTPIKLREFLAGGVLTGLLKCAIVLTLFSIAAVLVYNLHVPDLPLFMAGLFFLFVFGISIGMLNLAFIFPRGENAIFLVWTIPDIIVVLSGVYYPLEILPEPLHSFALLLPSSHAFNVIKETVGMAHADWFALVALSIVWFAGAWMFLKSSYRHAKKTGKLVRVG